MVQDVVFVVPGIGQKPVEPVDVPPPTAGEDLARVAAGNARNAVVSAVQDVMREQPTRELSKAEQEGAERIGNHPGCGIAHDRGHATVPLDASQMSEVGRANARMGLGLQSVDGGTEAGDIHSVELHRRRCLEVDAHAN